MSKEAMKLALEALEEAWYHVGTFQPTEKAIDLYDEARTALREALAEQPAQQEPVAWMWKDGTITSNPDRADGTWTPLYTTPPANANAGKPWVGLTEQEHTDIAIQCGCMSADWVFYGATVERILKEKNS